jgi:alpha-beta hydrolase superfamily lysophospholipase
MALCDRFVYSPNRRRYGSPDEASLRFEDICFAGPAGRLHGWWLPAVGEPRGTLVHLHGNAANITAHYRHVAWWPRYNFNVLCLDYRGFGRSAGKPDRRGVIDDSHAAVDYVLQRDDVDLKRVFLFGQSIGGSIGIVVAAERKDLAAIICDGPLSDHQAATYFICRRRWFTWGIARLIAYRWISRAWEPIDHVAAISPTPLLILQGTADPIIDWRMGDELYAAAGEPKALYIYENLGHCEALHLAADHARPRVLAFLDCALAGQPLPAADRQQFAGQLDGDGVWQAQERS